MNGQLRREEDEIRSIGVKTPTAQTDKLPYRQDNVRQKEGNQQQRTSTTAYNLKMPQQTQLFANKPPVFKSRYINDNGRWTQNAVDDGFVDIKDYISDIKNDEQGISFNGKEMKFSEQRSDEIAFVETNNPIKNSKLHYRWNNDFISKVKKGDWYVLNLGYTIADKAFEYGNSALNKAEKKAKEWKLSGTTNNKADAYRHFMWNATMTRDPEIGYYQARNVTNRYEYENMDNFGFLDEDNRKFDYLQDNTIIKGKMNQENLMDLWNNQVGRELANNSAFSDMSEGELFEFAQEYNLLINNANGVYNFLGITDYIKEGYLVDVEWNLTTGDVTVKNEKKSVTLKIGI